MALRFIEPTLEQIRLWKEWVASRPPVVKEIVEQIDPWTLYRIKDTGHRGIFYSVSEDQTITLTITGTYNLIDFERRVFGYKLNDLEPCDPPLPSEPVGVYMTPEEARAYINSRRAENGLDPLSDEDFKDMNTV